MAEPSTEPASNVIGSVRADRVSGEAIREALLR